MPRDLSELAVGEKWAYRRKQTEPVTCVEVARLGTGRPPRVQITFVDDEHEGRQEWVPPGRLKVLWVNVDAWRSNERRWTALRAACEYVRDSPEDNALIMISEYLSDWKLGITHYNDDGIMIIPDVMALAVDLDLDPGLIESVPVSFVDDDGDRIVPWRITRVILERLVRKYADIVVPKVEADEEEARQHNRWGYTSGGSFISAEICTEVDKEYGPARDLIRQWCGADAQDRYDELVALRVEVVRLGKLAERAISALRTAGDSPEADAFERELGIPLEVLRHAKLPDHGP